MKRALIFCTNKPIKYINIQSYKLYRSDSLSDNPSASSIHILATGCATSNDWILD